MQKRAVDTQYGTSDAPDALPRSRWAKMVGSYTAADTKLFATVDGKSLICFGGTHDGWEVSESPDAKPITIKPGQFEPGPVTNRLYFRTKGTGTLKIRAYPDGIGGAVAAAVAAAEAAAASSASSLATSTAVKRLVMDGTLQKFSPPAGTISTDVTYGKDNNVNESIALSALDANPPVEYVEIGVPAPLASETFDGIGDIFYKGNAGDVVIFISHVKG